MTSASENPKQSIFERKRGSLVVARRRSESARLERRFSSSAWLGHGQGFTLLEMIAAMTILLLLSTLALPVARVQVQRTREVELRRDLRDMREAIDRYKDYSDRGMIPVKVDTYGYPPDFQTLVDGVVLKGTAKGKLKFLRRIPIDPMTGKADWGFRSMQDDPDSTSWGGENLFDVYCPSTATALDGTKYSDW
jgi:general secretion pathway protein G